MSLPNKCVVDTNVPKTANLTTQLDRNAEVPAECILACIGAVEYVIRERALVVDEGNEIFNEYKKQLSLRGQPGVGDRFMKWVHDHRWGLPQDQRVRITRSDDSYEEFPTHGGLSEFDLSDRKFVAVANAHPDKPPILQATDSKWWGWKGALAQAGITVHFLCKDYVEDRYCKKMGT